MATDVYDVWSNIWMVVAAPENAKFAEMHGYLSDIAWT
jgi:hypothetical protein